MSPRSKWIVGKPIGNLVKRLHLETLEQRLALSADFHPLGALVEDFDLGSGSLAAGGSQSFNLVLDGNLNLSLLGHGSNGLAPKVQVLDPSSVPLETATGSPNGSALIQSLHAIDAGSYTFIVEADAGSAGDYSLSLLVNAAIDREQAGGAVNNTTTSAQDIAPSLLVVDPNLRQMAVSGVTATNDPDFFRFKLDDGQQVSFVLGASNQDVTLDLYSTGGTLLATSIATENAAQGIYGFVDQTTDGLADEYIVSVTTISPASVDYTLAIVSDNAFDIESNNSFVDAQASTDALAHIASNNFSDLAIRSDFAGIDSNQTTCDCQPPDPHIAVGDDHILQVVNTAIAVYDKSGQALLGPIELEDFFDASLVSGNSFIFDPVVTYDELAERFVVGVLIAQQAPAESDLLYAISDGPDPTQGFTEQHRFDFSPISPGLFADYPKIGWNADAHVFSLNMFQLSGGGIFQHTDILTIDKSSVLDANPNTIGSTIVKTPGLNSDFTLAAATMHGSLPGDPMWFVKSTFDGDSTIGVIRMDNVLSSTPTFTTFDLPVTPYLEPPAAAQPGGRTFRTNDARMLNSELRDGRLVATHTVGENGAAKARWYDIDITGAQPTLSQEGTIDPGPGISTYFPSIAINSRGDVGLTYMQSSASEFVSMYITGQVAGAATGTVSTPLLVAAGDQIYFGNRGGDYSGTFVDPVTDVFWSVNEVILSGAPDPLWSTWVAEYTVRPLPDKDWFRFPVVAGDTLTIETRTPYDAPDLPVNALDPTLELYAPDGSLVATDDNSAADNRNALISHSANATGEFRAVVQGSNNTAGTYVVQVDGNSGTFSPPTVINMNPFDGIAVAEFPTQVRLDFSQAILGTTVEAADLVVDGFPAIDVRYIDGDTLEFTLDPQTANAGDQTYGVVLAAAAMTDLGGRSIDAFHGSFTLDTAGPKITSTLWNNLPFPVDRTFSTGALRAEFSFNEQLFTLRSARLGLKSPSPNDVSLVETLTGETFVPDVVEFDGNLDVFSVEFFDLPEGNFELRLFSGDEAFEDELGNDLDGEPSGSGDGTPTGDGSAGGDYFVNFQIDNGSLAAALPEFQRQAPLGSLISVSDDVLGVVNSAGDQDVFETLFEAGQTISARITPWDANASLSLEHNGLQVSSSSPGASVVLPPQSIATTGMASIEVVGDLPTAFTLEVFRNANVDGLDAIASTIDLNTSLLDIGAARFGAVAESNGSTIAPTFAHYNDASAFIDISTTGTLMSLSDDGEEAITTTIGNPIIPAGEILVGNNGGIIVGGLGELPAVNTSLPSSVFDRALLPFWDDFTDTTGAVYWEQTTVGGIPTVIIQWHERSHFTHGDTATFQLQIFESGPVAARFAYQDVTFGFADIDFGASATIGYQVSNSESLVFSQNQPVLANGDVVDLLSASGTTDIDEFTVDLTASLDASLDVVLAGENAGFENELLELFDPGGNLVATGSNAPLGTAASGFDLAITNYSVQTAGTYTIRVTSLITGNYALVATAGAVFDLEPNNEPGESQRTVTDGVGALGLLGGREVQLKHFHDPSLFVDISATGQMLTAFDDGFDNITSSVGNSLIPAGPLSVGNNGGIVVGHNQFLPLNNISLPAPTFETALLPFWDDIDSETGGVFWEERTIEGINTLIVQWEDRPHFPNLGNASFQAQIFASGPIAARFVYEDVVFGSTAYDFGASATIGYQRDTNDAALFSFDTASLANGDVIDLFVKQTDEYLVALNANDELVLDVTTLFSNPGHLPINDLDLEISILDPTGVVSASTTGSQILFTAPSTGTFSIKVADEVGSGEYFIDLVINQTSGDFFPDGDLDCNDVDLLGAEIRAQTHNPMFDLNNDALVDFADLAEWVTNIKGTLFGDANLDYTVDAVDFLDWSQNRFGAGGWCEGDFDASGTVDGADFILWNDNRFQSIAPPAGLLPAEGTLAELTPSSMEADERDSQWAGGTPSLAQHLVDHYHVGTRRRDVDHERLAATLSAQDDGDLESLFWQLD